MSNFWQDERTFVYMLILTIGWIIFVLWYEHIANQYKAGRTEKFYVFKIVWQKISPGACMPREWSRKPARHFILILFGERIIEVFRSDLGLFVHICCKSIFSYHINQYKKTRRIDLFGYRYE